MDDAIVVRGVEDAGLAADTERFVERRSSLGDAPGEKLSDGVPFLPTRLVSTTLKRLLGLW